MNVSGANDVRIKKDGKLENYELTHALRACLSASHLRIPLTQID